jgi:hypothetical protein
MQPRTRVAVRRRPSKLQIALAAAWLIASLAIGAAVTAESGPDRGGSQTVSGPAQP